MNPLNQPQNLEVTSCFIQKHDSVIVPHLNDPQLQNLAVSIIENSKFQLSELKLADLYSQQLPGERRTQFISEFIYHWSGVDTKPPEALIESSRKNLHSIIFDFLDNNDIYLNILIDILNPILNLIENVTDVEELTSYLEKTIFSSTSFEEGADLFDLATLESVITEVSNNTVSTNDKINSENLRIQQINEKKLKDIQNAFRICLNNKNEENHSDNQNNSHISTTGGIFGSDIHSNEIESDL